MRAKLKDNLSVAVLGHYDAGKSTLTSHLMHKMARVNDAYIHKLQAEANLLGRQSYEYAFVVNNTK